MSGVTLNNLRKTYGDVAAVDDVSISIREGELLALLGPSGCGKTTTLRAIAGFVQPTSGSVHFGAKDVTRIPVHHRNVGMVFQGYALFPHLTVAKNIEFGLRLSPVAIGRAERLRTALWQRVREFQDRYELIVTPTVAVPPFPVETSYPAEIDGKPMRSYIEWVLLTYAFTMVGVPAISVPCGFTRAGLPVGLQIAGRRFGGRGAHASSVSSGPSNSATCSSNSAPSSGWTM